MRISKEGINFIKSLEGFSSKPYKCSANILTIGYGHTGKDVLENMVVSKKVAEAILVNDLIDFEDNLNSIVRPSINLNQNQFDALISLSYNIGMQAIAESTLIKVLNNAEYKKAANHFLDWIRAGTNIIPGLINRRLKERKLFLT